MFARRSSDLKRIVNIYHPHTFFISSFVSLTKYAGQKLKTVMWLRMAGKVMNTYIWSTVIWLMSRPLTVDNRPGFILHVDTYVFGSLLRSDQYVSNQYILDQNPRLSSYTIGLTYSDYISLLLVCGDCPLTSKRGVFWNLIPDSLDQVKSQIDSNTIYYFEFQTWNLALQPA